MTTKANLDLFIGERISTAMSLRRVPIGRLATEIRVDEESVRGWINGCLTIDVFHLVHIAHALGVSMDYLVGFASNPSVKPPAEDSAARELADAIEKYLTGIGQRMDHIEDDLNCLEVDVSLLGDTSESE